MNRWFLEAEMALRSKKEAQLKINVVHNYNGIFFTYQVGRDQSEL